MVEYVTRGHSCKIFKSHCSCTAIGRHYFLSVLLIFGTVYPLMLLIFPHQPVLNVLSIQLIFKNTLLTSSCCISLYIFSVFNGSCQCQRSRALLSGSLSIIFVYQLFFCTTFVPRLETGYAYAKIDYVSVRTCLSQNRIRI